MEPLYQDWKASVLGRVLNIDGVDRGQCTQVDLSWGMALFPNHAWSELFPPVPAARMMFSNYNAGFFQQIANDHSDPNQLPSQGDIMIFDYTPQPGYSNPYPNPYGHTGVCDSASASGYALLQENSPNFGSPVNVTTYPWRYRPCLGWLRPLIPAAPVAEYYLVQSGDTVDTICIAFHIDVSNNFNAFRIMNPQITDINLIFSGEKVRVR